MNHTKLHKSVQITLVFLTLFFLSGMSHAAELVNLNKANASAIQQNLVGIGPIKAEAIISYRKKNGKFKSLDDLQNVTGLGPALIKKNKRYLSLSKGAVKGDDKAYAAAKKQAGQSKSTKKKKASTSKSTSSKTAKKDKKSSTKDKKSTAAKSKKDKKKTGTTKKTDKKKKSTKKKTTKKSNSTT